MQFQTTKNMLLTYVCFLRVQSAQKGNARTLICPNNSNNFPFIFRFFSFFSSRVQYWNDNIFYIFVTNLLQFVNSKCYWRNGELYKWNEMKRKKEEEEKNIPSLKYFSLSSKYSPRKKKTIGTLILQRATVVYKSNKKKGWSRRGLVGSVLAY